MRVAIAVLALVGCARAPVPLCRTTNDTTRVVIPHSSIRAMRVTGGLHARVVADTEAVVIGPPTASDTLILTPNAWQGSPEVRILLAACRSGHSETP